MIYFIQHDTRIIHSVCIFRVSMLVIVIVEAYIGLMPKSISNFYTYLISYFYTHFFSKKNYIFCIKINKPVLHLMTKNSLHSTAIIIHLIRYQQNEKKLTISPVNRKEGLAYPDVDACVVSNT